MRRKMAGLAALTTIVAASCGAAPPESGAPSESIAVHGDWTIEVYNEDGTLDDRVEFSNDLTNPGARTIVELLTGSISAGQWEITVGDAVPDEICPSTGGVCFIVPTTTLVDRDGNGFEETIRLLGSVEAEADGEIVAVETRLGTCQSSQAPDSCALVGGVFNFTFRALDAPSIQPVSAGQTVQVQVDISFTTG